MNEGIARQANAEDECTGRFWEGRFKSQALLDEAALIAAMAYVDLNPVRAKMAKTPETSAHTSVKRRIQQAQSAHSPNHPQQQVKELLPFVGNPRAAMPKGLPFMLTDYLELVDWSGRIIRERKPGYIDQSMPPILERLNIEPGIGVILSITSRAASNRLSARPLSSSRCVRRWDTNAHPESKAVSITSRNSNQ